jgi:hypothetical protein
MKNTSLSFLLLSSVLLLSSCSVVGGIFKAGIWTGIIIVAIVVILIIWLLSRGSRK